MSDRIGQPAPVIERVESRHLSEIAEIERLCFSEPWSEQALLLLTGADALGFAAVGADGEVLAYGGMLLAPDEGQITNVAVHPDHRRKGLGKAVLEALLNEAARRGLSQAVLEVRVSNDAAITLYEKAGFVTLGERRNFYRHPLEHARIMGKTLGDGSLPL